MIKIQFVATDKRVNVTDLLHAIYEGAMNIQCRAFAHIKTPWQLWLVEIIQETDGKVSQYDGFVGEARRRSKEGGETR